MFYGATPINTRTSYQLISELEFRKPMGEKWKHRPKVKWIETNETVKKQNAFTSTIIELIDANLNEITNKKSDTKAYFCLHEWKKKKKIPIL